MTPNSKPKFEKAAALALEARPPATQLAAPASPSQQPSLALAAAARASLDASELQDVRGSKCPPEVRRVRPR